MSNIISKELLSEVLGKDIGRIEDNDNIEFWWSKTDTYCGSINVYELAHKCKEWAKNQGYFINSSYGKYEDGIKAFATFNWELNGEVIPSSFVLETWFKADAEPDAIFKACQWILDNKDKQ